jgi:UDP-galactopyranose mutase
MFDYLIVGAGFAGSTIAERIASVLGRKVLIVDKRKHIGGNAYDCYDDAGLLIHKYGPHIFHQFEAGFRLSFALYKMARLPASR